jgi:hypothetical protein
MTMYDDNRVVTLLRDIEPPLSDPDRFVHVSRRARRSESRRASALAGVMAVVLMAGVVSALSLHDRDGTEVLSVADAAAATSAARTARVTLDVSFSGAGAEAAALAGGPASWSGPVDFERHRFALKGRFGGTDSEMRGIGNDRWVLQPGLPGKKWVHSTESEGDTGFEQIDPAKLLGVLTSKGTELSRKVDGDRTVFVLKVPANVLSPGGTGQDEAAPDVLTVTVDASNRVRVLTTTLDQGAPGSVSVKLRMAYDDFGIDVDVQPPPSDQVQEQSDLFGTGSSSSGQSQTFSSQLGSNPEACAAFAKQERDWLARIPESKRAEMRKVFEQMKSACAKKP